MSRNVCHLQHVRTAFALRAAPNAARGEHLRVAIALCRALKTACDAARWIRSQTRKVVRKRFLLDAV